jgi:hypothetical protein
MSLRSRHARFTVKRGLAAATTVLAMAGLGAGSVGVANADSCPNAGVRVGTPSATLPDCRGYEMVSPLDKNLFDVISATVAPDASRVLFATAGGGFGDAESAPLSSAFLATRTGGSWTTKSVNPPVAPNAELGLEVGGVYMLANDLTHGLELSYSALIPGDFEEPEFWIPYDRNFLTGAFTNLGPEAPHLPGLHRLEGAVATSNFSHIVYEGNGYSPDTAVNVNSVYEWVDGKLRDVGILPGGALEAEGSKLGTYGTKRATISDDGSRIFFAGGKLPRQLYVRENGSTTVPVSASQRTPAEPEGEATYMGASDTGSLVFFTDTARLTNDATSEGDLYQFDVDSRVLSDITADANPLDVGGAGFLDILNYSQDGQYLYFAATGQMVPGQGISGQPNVYLAHAGTITYVTTLSFEDAFDWHESPSVNRTRISADGHRLSFLSVLPLTGYENKEHTEMFLYDLDSGQIQCVSCNPTGGPATSDVAYGGSNFNGGSRQSSNMSSDGARLFFQSQEALVPQDTNGATDVYEWEAGKLYLLSGGQGNEISRFQAATPSGDDALITTRDRLVGQDTDGLADVYDARVGGGLPAPPPAPTPCSDEGCHPPRTAPPISLSPGSIAFSGPGNLTQPAKAVVKPPKKKVKKKHRRKKSKRTKHVKQAKHNSYLRTGR